MSLSEYARKNGVKYFLISFVDLFGTMRAKIVPATAIALAYVLHQPFPTFPLFGPRTIAEARSSMTGLSVELSPEQVAWLDLRA